MRTFTESCIAAGEAAGWSGAALQRLVLDPRSATPDGFRARLAEANEIRGLVAIMSPTMRALGYHPETMADYCVAQGHTLQELREDTVRVMAQADESTVVDTTRRNTTGRSDPYAAREAEIDAYKGKTP
ncbi:MAG TPA: hypothetical protein VJ577_16665 [Burkholderiaceae bacterium]|nr:hypothetical protein [Burkholderiaceae bacterium]